MEKSNYIPKLSIITINYNNADGLKQTLHSVLEQTYQEYEYIIIDGGSNDESKQHILACQDRLGYWCSEKDKGIYNAMNKGILKATGEYILFLNSGDYLHDNKVLEKVIPNLSGEDIVYGDLLLLDNGGKTKVRVYPDHLSLRYMLSDTIGHPASFIKRDLFSGSLYSENLKIVSDWEFFLKKIIKCQASYKHIALLVSVFDLTGISSANIELCQKEREIVLHNEFSFLVCEELKQFYFFQDQPLFSLYRKIMVSKRFQKRIRILISALWKIHCLFHKNNKWS